MVEQKIEFRKTRDFGENLNDTFSFIRLNFSPLLKSIFAICAIFMLIHAILTGLYLQGYNNFWELLLSRTIPRHGARPGYFDAQYFLIKISKWVAIVSLHVCSVAYIKYYVENNGARPGIDEVWAIFRKYFFKVLLLSLPVVFSVSIGMLFCLVPGVYLMVVFLPFSVIAMVEDTSVPETLARCFNLVRNNFWTSFLIYMVVILIYGCSTLLTGLIISGFMGLINYFTTYNLTSWIRMLTSFFNIFAFCFYLVVMVSVALNYFSLVEEKDGTGILLRINNIGNFKKKPDPLEEY